MHKKGKSYHNVNNAVYLLMILIFTITLILSFSNANNYLPSDYQEQETSAPFNFLNALTGMATQVTATLNFTIWPFIHNITVHAPLNGSLINSADIYFNYTAYGNSDMNISCNLTIDGEVNQTITNIQREVMESTLVNNLDFGFHLWNLTCWYIPTVTFTTGTYNFTNSFFAIDYDLWDSIVYPEGIYEPHNPAVPGTRLSNIEFKFVNVSADILDQFSCLVEQSNGNLIEIKDSPSDPLINENFTISYLVESSDNITKNSPWKIKNCSFYRQDILIHTDNDTYNLGYHNNSYNPRPILIRGDNVWTKFDTAQDDAYLASSCFLGFAGEYFNNTLKCDYVGDVAFAVSMAEGFNMERICNDGIDNDGNGFIDCDDRYCQGIPYPCKPHEYIGNHFNTCVNGVCTATVVVGTKSITYSYNRYIKTGETLKVRFNVGNVFDTRPIRYAITHLQNDDYSSKSGRYNNTYENTSYLDEIEISSSSVTVKAEEGYQGQIDFVTWVNLSSTLYPEGEHNFSLHLIHYGDDLLVTGIPITVDDDAPSVWNESDTGTGRVDPCTTNIDEDFDYLISCADPDCWGHVGGVNYYNGSDAYCSEFEICDDGFDNNRDGLIDCEDDYCDLKVAKPFPEFPHPLNSSMPIRCHYSGEGNVTYDGEDYNWIWACTDGFNNDAEGGFSSYVFGPGGNVDCWDETYCWGRGGNSTDLPCPMFENNTVEWCFDGIDNDYDGYVDCLDIDCLGAEFIVTQNFLDNYNESYYIEHFNRTPVLDEYLVCSTSEPINVFNETEPARCFDGIDNDFDGYIDCSDPDCWGITYEGVTCLPVEFNLTAWLENYRFDTLMVNVSYCSDDIDNDGDGDIDCDDDDCKQKFGYCGPCPSYENYTWFSCSNQKDDNNDGLVDCESPHCLGLIGSFESSQICSDVEICDDGFDNTGNGLIDCADPDCLGELGPDGQICASSEDTDALCSDGFDNTGNGIIDCMNPSCWNTDVCSSRYWSVVSNTVVPYMTGWRQVGQTSIDYRNLQRHYVNTNYILRVRGNAGSYDSITITIGSATGVNFPYDATSCVLTGDTDKIMWSASQVEVGQLQNIGSPIVGGFEVELNCSAKDTPVTNTPYPIIVVNEPDGSTESGEETLPTRVYENDPPNITAIEVSPNITGVITVERDSSLSVRGIPTDDESGISGCFFKLKSDSYEHNSNTGGNCIATFSNIVDRGLYTLNVSARDGVNNIGDISSYSFNINVLPKQNYILIDGSGNAYPFFNSSKNEIINFESSFSSAESGVIESCVAYIEDENGNIVDSKNIPVVPDKTIACNSNFDISSLSEGKYHIYIEAEDDLSQTVVSDKKVFFNCPTYGNSYDYCIMADFNKDGFRDVGDPIIGSCDYTDIPVILLISPADGHSTSPSEIIFKYKVYHSENISNCSLIINNNVVNTDSNISLGETTDFSKSMSAGDYQWKVYCVDTNDLGTYSPTYNLKITTPSTPSGPSKPTPPPPEEPEEEEEPCTYDWVCSEWTPEICPPSEIQTRDCVNLGTCTDDVGKPATQRTCTYVMPPVEDDTDLEEILKDIVQEVIRDRVTPARLTWARGERNITIEDEDRELEFIIDYEGARPKFRLGVHDTELKPVDYWEWPDWIKVSLYLLLIAAASFAGLFFIKRLRDKYLIDSLLYREILRKYYSKQLDVLSKNLGVKSNKYVYIMAMWKYQKFIKRITGIDGRKTRDVLNRLKELNLEDLGTEEIYKKYILRISNHDIYNSKETSGFVNQIKNSIQKL